MSGYPIVEQIAQAISTALATCISTALQYPASSVVRPNRDGSNVAPCDGLVVLEQGGEEPDETNSPEGYAQYVQTFLITFYVVPSDGETGPVELIANFMGADLRKALMADPQFGGLAIDSAIGGASMLEKANGALAGQTFELLVNYRTLITDPYSKGS